MEFEFRPTKEQRTFSAQVLVGKRIDVTFDKQDEKGNQQVRAHSALIPASLWDWVKGQNYPEGTKKLRIKAAYLMEHMNGGRQDQEKYPSYQAYFNAQKRLEVQAYQTGGMYSKLFRGGGNPDEVDLSVEFDKFTLSSSMWDLKAPEEWYSLAYATDLKFRFEAGFYATAEEAQKSFSEKATTDIFGTRYFPVICFPLKTITDGGEHARSIADYAKAASRPIVTKQHVIFGTRCKPDEVNEVINQTYQTKGMVARAMTWDWD